MARFVRENWAFSWSSACFCVHVLLDAVIGIRIRPIRFRGSSLGSRTALCVRYFPNLRNRLENRGLWKRLRICMVNLRNVPKIELRPAAVFTLCLLFYLEPLGAFVPFVLAACAHEAGHLLAVFVCGGTVTAVRIGGAGAEIRTDTLPYARQVMCALAGPAVNIVLFFLTAQRFESFAAVNLLLAAYNLLPVEPLDGGTALRALLLWIAPQRQELLNRVIRCIVLVVLSMGAIFCSFWLRGGIWPLLLLGILILRFPNENPVAKRRAVP